jgi:hypothetical protein
MSQSLIIRLIVQQVYLEKTLDATPVPPPPRVPRRAPRLRTMMFCARPGPLCFALPPVLSCRTRMRCILEVAHRCRRVLLRDHHRPPAALVQQVGEESAARAPSEHHLGQQRAGPDEPSEEAAEPRVVSLRAGSPWPRRPWPAAAPSTPCRRRRRTAPAWSTPRPCPCGTPCGAPPSAPAPPADRPTSKSPSWLHMQLLPWLCCCWLDPPPGEPSSSLTWLGGWVVACDSEMDPVLMSSPAKEDSPPEELPLLPDELPFSVLAAESAESTTSPLRT